MKKIYLDEAATSKVKPEVIEAVMQYMTDEWYNPSSLYNGGKRVRKAIDNARKNVADFIGAKEEEIIFTSGSTESNNMVIRGFDDYYKLNISTIITTPIEHSSIFKVLENCDLTSDVYLCEVDKYGFVDFEVLEELLEYKKEGTLLVSIGMANNEIGTVQDIKKISELVHSYNGILHVDATQALAHIPIDVNELGIDLLSASAHKIGGLKGTGFLYKRTCIELKPLIYGEQEKNMRGGTENTIGIIALGEAIKHIEYNPMLVHKRDYMLYRLENRFNCKLNGDLFERLPNNINVTFPDVTGESLLYSLDLANIFVSISSACKGNSSEPSHVLKAIGLTEEEAMRTVRFTLPVNITFEEIDIVLEEIDKAIKIISNEEVEQIE
jgi:cysteine desulfurase